MPVPSFEPQSLLAPFAEVALRWHDRCPRSSRGYPVKSLMIVALQPCEERVTVAAGGAIRPLEPRVGRAASPRKKRRVSLVKRSAIVRIDAQATPRGNARPPSSIRLWARLDHRQANYEAIIIFQSSFGASTAWTRRKALRVSSSRTRRRRARRSSASATAASIASLRW
jgi:hypothetical protein